MRKAYFPPSPPRKTDPKRKFMVAYVLARAATRKSGLDGDAAAKQAAKAWAAIEQECQ